MFAITKSTEMAGKLVLRVGAVLMLCGAVVSQESSMMMTIQCKKSDACFPNPNEGMTNQTCPAPTDFGCTDASPQCYSLAVYTTKGGKNATLLTDRGCKKTPTAAMYVPDANFAKNCKPGMTTCTSGFTLTSKLQEKVKEDLRSGKHTLCVKCCNTAGCNNDLPPRPKTKPPAATPKPKPQPSNARNTLPTFVCNALAAALIGVLF